MSKVKVISLRRFLEDDVLYEYLIQGRRRKLFREAMGKDIKSWPYRKINQILWIDGRRTKSQYNNEPGRPEEPQQET